MVIVPAAKKAVFIEKRANSYRSTVHHVERMAESVSWRSRSGLLRRDLSLYKTMMRNWCSRKGLSAMSPVRDYPSLLVSRQSVFC